MKAPHSVVSNQQYNFGRYNSPFRDVNLLDAPKSAPINAIKSFFLREWQAFQIFTDGFFGIMAIYNTKKISLVQFILYDINEKRKIKFEKKVAPWSLEIAKGLFKTQSVYQSSDCTMNVSHDLDQGLLDIIVDIKKGKNHPSIKAKLSGQHNVEQFTPIVVCLPFNPDRGMYSHKCLMPLKGSIHIDNKEILLNVSTSNLIIDDHKGYYPYVTKYDWLTGAGFDKQGRRIGFNFTDNQIQNKEVYNENGLWIDGRLYFLPAIKMTRPNGYEKDWIIKDEKGKVDLTFTPVQQNAVYLNVFIMKSDYQGPYGYINGRIKTEEGNIMIENIFGMGEDFYLKS